MKLERALVTGASSGIGAATVRALSASGREVLAVARRHDRLEALAETTGARILAADVRDLSTLDAAADFAPDILVNNAGVGHGMDGLLGLGPDVHEESVAINVLGPVRVTAAILPGMKARGRGHVVNVGSIAGLHASISALYGATKAAVHMFSQNLRYELAGTGLRVTEVCPGRVTSEIYSAARGDRRQLDAMYESGIRELDPEDIAAAIMFAVNAPDHVNVATIEVLPTDQTVGGITMRRSGR